MFFSFVWTVLMAVGLVCALTKGTTGLSAAALAGAQKGVTVSIAMAGAICLWSGVSVVMEKAGIKDGLARLFLPLLGKVFPDIKKDPVLAGNLSGNFCANLLGLGNAATPMGIAAARGLAHGDIATDQMCRLVVLNTASIQLIPATVAGVRAALGCAAPFDILPAVWITSLCSAGLGTGAAWMLGKLWKE